MCLWVGVGDGGTLPCLTSKSAGLKTPRVRQMFTNNLNHLRREDVEVDVRIVNVDFIVVSLSLCLFCSLYALEYTPVLSQSLGRSWVPKHGGGEGGRRQYEKYDVDLNLISSISHINKLESFHKGFLSDND